MQEVISEFKRNGIRTSIFVDPDPEMVKAAVKTGTDRIELYTEDYARQYTRRNSEAVRPYAECAAIANELGLGINAGHDLSLQNTEFFRKNIPGLLEVSIGHALISEALYMGLENVIQQYLNLLQEK